MHRRPSSSTLLPYPPFFISKLFSNQCNHLFCDLDICPSSVKQQCHHLFAISIIPCCRLHHLFCDLDICSSLVKQQCHHFFIITIIYCSLHHFFCHHIFISSS